MARIAHIANLYGPKSGGLKTAMNSIAQEYANLGHDVMLIVPGERNLETKKPFGTVVEIKAPIIPFSGGYRIIFNTNKVKEKLKRFAPSFLEISDRTTLLRLADWAKTESIDTAFYAHERVDKVVAAFLPFLPFKKPLINYANQKIANKVDHIIATTEYAATEFRRLSSSNNLDSKLAISPLGVDLIHFSPNNSNSESKVKNANEQKILLACTRFSKEKDPDFLLDIARACKINGTQIQLVIAGSGPLTKKLVARAEKEDLPVSFIGFISDKNYLAQLLASADLFLAVGPIETFGLAALEALASGTPVICRDTSAITEIIDSKCGYSLPRDSSRWAEQIRNHFDLDQVAISKFARGRAEEFSWEESARKLLSRFKISQGSFQEKF
ncbi:MAG: glycosyltransferase [Actinobacteria bacterium]|nr:glycosyltransferase [Actinomycetota bacterium]